jgi:hypothetical protein
MLRSAVFVAAGLLAGCASLGNAGREQVRAPAAAPSGEMLQAAQLSAYLNSLQRLVQGSPAEQAEVLAATRAGYESVREGPAQLRYALALAAPGHPGRDALLAQKLLRETLSRPELLTVTERALAVVELQRIDDELRLVSENARMLTEAQRERERQRVTTPNVATARRLQTEMEENARLRKALEEARAKLDAIANIERSISDRPPATEGRTP